MAAADAHRRRRRRLVFRRAVAAGERARAQAKHDEQIERCAWSDSWIERQVARGGGVFELGAAREHIEAGDVEIELGAGERAARVDELDLADDAFVALAAGDAERGARGIGARSGGRQRIARSRQAVERLLNFEPDLLRDLFLAQDDLALGGARFAHARRVAAAIEQAAR